MNQQTDEVWFGPEIKELYEERGGFTRTWYIFVPSRESRIQILDLVGAEGYLLMETYAQYAGRAPGNQPTLLHVQQGATVLYGWTAERVQKIHNSLVQAGLFSTVEASTGTEHTYLMHLVGVEQNSLTGPRSVVFAEP